MLTGHAEVSSASFEAMGCVNTVVVEQRAMLDEAFEIARSEVCRLDQACSRFREDSELSRLNARTGIAVPLSQLLERALEAAIRSAEMTGGLVDPTVGACVREIGYTVTFRHLPIDGPAIRLEERRVPGWRCLGYDPKSHTVCVPHGVQLDLGASAKAWAADRAALAINRALGVGAAVVCGGDMGTAGAAPPDGWRVRVAARADSADWQDVRIFDGGLATSGTTSRHWRRGGIELHHIIDPLTGLPARTCWNMVSVAAASCLDANAAATAAVILGPRAVAWLDERSLPARLVAVDGSVRYAGGWT